MSSLTKGVSCLAAAWLDGAVATASPAGSGLLFNWMAAALPYWEASAFDGPLLLCPLGGELGLSFK